MAISDSQKVDLLYKKIAWSVAKTDTNPPKEAYNEANPSPLLIRGDTMWQQSGDIPTTIPTTTSSIVQVYKDGSGTWSPTIECTELAVTDNRTWSTGLTNWIDPQFGATYFVKVYVDTVGSTTPQTTGTALQAAGLNDDQWYFDYQAGILNFIGTNLPTSIATGVTGKSVFISGARYIGAIGSTNFVGGLSLGNITVNGNTITGNTGVSFGGNITTTGNLLTNGFFWANGSPVIFSNYGNSNVALLLSGFGSNTISTTGNITGNIRTDYISTNLTSVTVFKSTGAITLPIGGNIARPASPTAGQLRYNSDSNIVEFYNGSGWVSVISNIDGEQFSGDGTNSVFTLKNGTTQNGILVSINGTVQQPGFAYTVVGNQITFAEVPLTTDQIDVRYLAAATANNFDDIVINITSTPVGTANTIIDSFDSTIYRSVKYIVSGTTHMAEIQILQNSGVVLLNTYGVLNTDSNTINYYANINGSTVNLLASGTVSSTIKLQRTYFII